MENILIFLKDIFNDNLWLLILLISMCPLLESKIAIPLGLNFNIVGNETLNSLYVWILAIVGSMLPCYIIMLIAKHIRHKTAFLYKSSLSKYYNKSIKLNNKIKKYLYLIFFVAIPLPLTGVWSGSIIAGLSNLNINKSFLCIFIGSIISSSLTTLLCVVFSNSIIEILISTIILIILFLSIDFILSLLKKNKANF